MDFKRNHPLDLLLTTLTEQNRVVGKARNDYLGKEAERKTFEARLVKAAAGKSHAERLINAQATDEWLEFQKALARLESIYEFEKFKLVILDKEWLSTYQEIKGDGPMIKRGVGA